MPSGALFSCWGGIKKGRESGKKRRKREGEGEEEKKEKRRGEERRERRGEEKRRGEEMGGEERKGEERKGEERRGEKRGSRNRGEPALSRDDLRRLCNLLTPQCTSQHRSPEHLRCSKVYEWLSPDHSTRTATCPNWRMRTPAATRRSNSTELGIKQGSPTAGSEESHSQAEAAIRTWIRSYLNSSTGICARAGIFEPCPGKTRPAVVYINTSQFSGTCTQIHREPFEAHWRNCPSSASWWWWPGLAGCR